jgi:hypothetical protein
MDYISTSAHLIINSLLSNLLMRLASGGFLSNYKNYSRYIIHYSFLINYLSKIYFSYFVKKSTNCCKARPR